MSFENNGHLLEIDLHINDVFPLYTQEVMLQEILIKLVINKSKSKIKKTTNSEVLIKSVKTQSKLKIKKTKKCICTQVKVAKEATYSCILRRVHLYKLKKSSKIVIGVYYLTVIFWIKKKFYVALAVFFVIVVAFQFMKSAFVMLVGLEMTIYFVVTNV